MYCPWPISTYVYLLVYQWCCWVFLFLNDIFCFETSITSSKLILEKGFPPISLTSKEKIHLFPRKTFRRIKIHTEMLALLSGCHLSHSVYIARHCIVCVFSCWQSAYFCAFSKKISTFSRSGDWTHAQNYVAKRYIEEVDRDVYFQDVRLQMDAKVWGEEYNRHNPPKKV